MLGVLSGNAKIEKGIHKVSPIFINGSRFSVYWNGVEGYIRSGCMRETIAWWDDNLVRCATEHNYTPEQVEEYKIYFEAVKKWMVLKGVEKEELANA